MQGNIITAMRPGALPSLSVNDCPLCHRIARSRRTSCYLNVPSSVLSTFSVPPSFLFLMVFAVRVEWMEGEKFLN